MSLSDINIDIVIIWLCVMPKTESWEGRFPVSHAVAYTMSMPYSLSFFSLSLTHSQSAHEWATWGPSRASLSLSFHMFLFVCILPCVSCLSYNLFYSMLTSDRSTNKNPHSIFFKIIFILFNVNIHLNYYYYHSYYNHDDYVFCSFCLAAQNWFCCFR